MFNTYIHKAASFPSTININEHRAPTDDSIRLADEMREKLLRSLVISQVDADNVITGVIVEVNDTFGEKRIFVGFMLNGKKYEIELTTDRRELISDKVKLFRRLVHLVAEAITEDILVRCHLDKFASAIGA
jgi:hypothetical protein